MKIKKNEIKVTVEKKKEYVITLSEREMQMLYAALQALSIDAPYGDYGISRREINNLVDDILEKLENMKEMIPV